MKMKIAVSFLLGLFTNITVGVTLLVSLSVKLYYERPRDGRSKFCKNTTYTDLANVFILSLGPFMV